MAQAGSPMCVKVNRKKTEMCRHASQRCVAEQLERSDN